MALMALRSREDLCAVLGRILGSSMARLADLHKVGGGAREDDVI